MAIWLLRILVPNSFALRFLAVLVGIIGLAVAVANVLTHCLLDPWDTNARASLFNQTGGYSLVGCVRF